jgi:ribosome biogenesis protein ENP2
MLKPYMHGYFMSLKLYDTARVIANPFAYAEHREKLAKEKMEKMAETRIRMKKDGGVKVNKTLAEKILKEEERANKREERRRARKVGREGADSAMVVDDEGVTEKEKPNLLTDPRFSRLFEDPDFTVDENSREYALMNPSAVAQKMNGKDMTRTAVEEEEEESDKTSSDGMGVDESDSENASGDHSGSDSSDAGGEPFLSLVS